MGPRSIRKSIFRRMAPFVVVLSGTVGATDAIMASDPCRVMVVRKLVEATEKVGERVPARRKHTKATLAAWEVWGKQYLEKHGHPFVPPKRSPGSRGRTPKEFQSQLKFACDVLPLPTYDIPLDTMLIPEDLGPPDSGLPVLAAELLPGPEVPQTTPRTTTTTATNTPTSGFPPIFIPPFGGGGGIGGTDIPPGGGGGGGTTPPGGGGGGGDTPPGGGGGDTPPGGGGGTIPTVPEPGSWLLLGTGVSAVLTLRRRGLQG